MTLDLIVIASILVVVIFVTGVSTIYTYGYFKGHKDGYEEAERFGRIQALRKDSANGNNHSDDS